MLSQIRCNGLRSPAFTSGARSLAQRSVAVRHPTRYSSRVVRAMATAEKTVLVPIGTGSEEMEAIITVDVLRRAGAKVTVASVEDSLEVTCSRGVKIVADKLMKDAATDSYDLIACPVSSCFPAQHAPAGNCSQLTAACGWYAAASMLDTGSKSCHSSRHPLTPCTATRQTAKVALLHRELAVHGHALEHISA